MHDEELRALVRDAVERHLTGHAKPARAEPVRSHASHARFLVASGGDEDGPCLIEPVVRCNHCGYCQSYGH
jgi:hypothetical protein